MRRYKPRPRPHKTRLIDMTGRVVGMWRVRRRAPNGDEGQVQWVCLCAADLGGCGEEFVVHGASLRAGTSSACMSCAQRARAARRPKPEPKAEPKPWSPFLKVNVC